MRAVTVAGLGLVGLAASGAAAQERVVMHHGPGASYPPPGAVVTHQAPPPPVAHHGPGRWGSRIDGRWWGGANAPGGWAAYRRPVRGVTLSPYWTSSRFYVYDWADYGLPQPPTGYNWVRYYDDAVLIDGRGSVYDAQHGVDWDRTGGYHAGARAYAAPVYPEGNFDPRRYQRRDDGLGGAAIGAVAGGALGAAVAGRGDRLGGALIGGGVGAITGYAVDRAEDRGRVPPPPPPYGYGPGYPPPHGAYGAPHVQTYTVPAGGSHTVFVGPGVTTVTVTTQPAVTTTTTTTEYHDETVTYTRPVKRTVKKVYRKPAYRSKTKTRCRC